MDAATGPQGRGATGPQSRWSAEFAITKAGPLRAVSGCAGTDDPERPQLLNVRLADLDRYAPPGRSTQEIRAWLQAPLRGAPLLRRLLQPLVGLPVFEIELGPDRPGQTFARLLQEEAWFGWGTGAERHGRSPGLCPTPLTLPGDGVAAFDLAGFVRSARGVPREALLTATEAWPRCVSLGRSQGGFSSGLGFDRVVGRYFPAATSSELVATSVAALEGRITGLSPVGLEQDGLLAGVRARVAHQVRIEGPCAVGDFSRIEKDVVLGHGASVGRRCVVGRGAVLERCVVLDDSFVRPGEVLRGVVRGPQGDLD